MQMVLRLLRTELPTLRLVVSPVGCGTASSSVDEVAREHLALLQEGQI